MDEFARSIVLDLPMCHDVMNVKLSHLVSFTDYIRTRYTRVGMRLLTSVTSTKLVDE